MHLVHWDVLHIVHSEPLHAVHCEFLRIVARLLLTVELPGVRGGRDITLDVGEVSQSPVTSSPLPM